MSQFNFCTTCYFLSYSTWAIYRSVSVVTDSCNRLWSLNNQMPCIIPPSVVARCLLYFPQVLNLAFRNQRSVNPRRQPNVVGSMGLIANSCLLQSGGEQIVPQVTNIKGTQCTELSNEAQLKQLALNVHPVGILTWLQISNITHLGKFSFCRDCTGVEWILKCVDRLREPMYNFKFSCLIFLFRKILKTYCKWKKNLSLLLSPYLVQFSLFLFYDA